MNTLLYQTVTESVENESEPGKQVGQDQYHSVEVSLNGLTRQFKLWNMASTPMCVLVKEDSRILPWLKVGEMFNVKYHAAEPAHPPQYLETLVVHVTKNDQGRFQGHYLVGLRIVEGQATKPRARMAVC